MKWIAVFIYLFVSPASAESALTARLRQLVEINSGSNNVDGVLKIQTWLSEELKKLHFDVSLSSDHLLVAELKGQETKTITFIMHADTVFEKTSSFQHFTMSDDGKTAHGPGVIDDKGGIVVAVEGLKRYLAKGPSKFNLRIVSSPSEEIGSEPFIERFKKISNDSFLILGFEPATDGNIVESRRGNRWYHIVSEGKEVHSGRDHKNGINACWGLAEKLVAISKLTNYEKNVTVSIGHMSGGQDKYNIMCGHAEAKIDVRFSNTKDRDDLHKKIVRIVEAPSKTNAKISFDLANDGPPLTANKKSQPYIQQYLAIVNKIEGRPIKAQSSAGSADSSYFGRPDVAVIDGLGPIGAGLHIITESIDLDSLERRSEALAQFLLQL